MTKMIGTKARIRNPALQQLEPLVGEWQTIGTHPYLPDTTLHGRTSFEWIEGGAFLKMRSQIDHPEFPDGVAIFGSDDASQTYYQIYFDERGISRKYDVSIASNQLAWWRNDPHLSQRFTLNIEKDKLIGIGEMSQGDGIWGKDLSLVYTHKVS